MDGIAEDDRVGQTCQRSIVDWYLTEVAPKGTTGQIRTNRQVTQQYS